MKAIRRDSPDHGREKRPMIWHQAKRCAGWWLVAIVSSGCQLFQPAPASTRHAELVAQVERYLVADDQQAEPLLPALVGRSTDELVPALRRALTDPLRWTRDAIKTGLLPNQTIRVGDQTMRYGLYVPPSYRPARAYPLVICLHGAGFNGDNYLERWQPRLGDAYILACPSIDDGAWWTREGEGLVLAVVDEVSRLYHIDPDRLFLTGMSNGAIGTDLIGLNHTDRFAALVPMAGAFPQGLYPLFDNARQTSFYLIHGSQDQVMPVYFSRNVAAYLKKNGFSVVYREHDRVNPMAGGHFFPREELPELVAWLNEQQRHPSLTESTLVRDRDHLGRAGWVSLDQVAPEVASFWASEHDEEEGRRLERGAFARLVVRLDGNTAQVTTTGVRRYSLWFSPGAIDFQQPVRVVTNGRTSFDGVIKPDGRLLLEEARRRPDPAQLVLSKIEIQLPQ